MLIAVYYAMLHVFYVEVAHSPLNLVMSQSILCTHRIVLTSSPAFNFPHIATTTRRYRMPAATVKKITYGDMAKEAIVALKERTGSSVQKIKATIVTKYPALAFQAVSNLPAYHPSLTFQISVVALSGIQIQLLNPSRPFTNDSIIHRHFKSSF
jgi:hypothetical protein